MWLALSSSVITAANDVPTPLFRFSVTPYNALALFHFGQVDGVLRMVLHTYGVMYMNKLY